MISKKSKKKFPSELRMDLVSNDWVIIATGRSRRPESFLKIVKRKQLILKKIVRFVMKKILKKK